MFYATTLNLIITHFIHVGKSKSKPLMTIYATTHYFLLYYEMMMYGHFPIKPPTSNPHRSPSKNIYDKIRNSLIMNGHQICNLFVI